MSIYRLGGASGEERWQRTMVANADQREFFDKPGARWTSVYVSALPTGVEILVYVW